MDFEKLIEGLTEIKNGMTVILETKYDGDCNALEEQQAWLENQIKELKKL